MVSKNLRSVWTFRAKPCEVIHPEDELIRAATGGGFGEIFAGHYNEKGNRIIAEGFNLRESSNDPVAHAELLAISRAGRALGEWRLSDCSLAVDLASAARWYSLNRSSSLRMP